MSQIIAVRLEQGREPKQFLRHGESWLLSGFVQLPDDVVLGLLADGVTKSEALAGIFSAVPPTANGECHFELGIVLPSWHPTIEGRSEWTISVPTDDEDQRTLAFSNQMRRLRYRNPETGIHVHALAPAWLVADPPVELSASIEAAHIEPLQTVATTRFVVNAESSEAALEDNLDSFLYEFFLAVNRVNSAHLMLFEPAATLAFPELSRGSIGSVYVVAANPDSKQVAAQRLALDVRQAAMHPLRDYSEDESRRFKALVTGASPIDRALLLLNSARSYLESGLLHLAVLQLAVAAEIATTRFVERALLAGGVSGKKLSSARRDLTYSTQLNVLLRALCPVGRKPSSELIGLMNRVRILRNAYMHGDELMLDHVELRRLSEATREYIEVLEELAREESPTNSSLDP